MKLISSESGYKLFKSHRAEPYFSFVKEGRKTLEGRIYKGEYRNISRGDHIQVFNNNESDSVEVSVVDMRLYDSIVDMLNKEPIDSLLPGTKSIEDGISIYREFYTKEQEEEYGVVVLEINRV